MMRSPNAYISQFENSEYLDLIKARNQLIDYIQSYEKSEIAGDRSGKEWGIHPQPDVRYQMYLEYLGKLCELMQKKYNDEYLWGDRSLQEDAKQ